MALSKTRRLQFFGTSDLLLVVTNLKTKIESFYLKKSGIYKMSADTEKGIANWEQNLHARVHYFRIFLK